MVTAPLPERDRLFLVLRWHLPRFICDTLPGRTRALYCSKDVPLLSALDTALPKRLGNGFLFSLDGGETPLTHDKVTELYDQYRGASGVTVTPHQIRHGYATALFENGIDPKTAQTLLGHAQLSTTMDIYTHVCQDVIAAAAEKMEKGF